MNKLFPILFLSIALLASCGGESTKQEPTNSKQAKADKINELEQQLYDTKDETPDLDRQAALDVVKLYQQFADTFPDDPRSPQYLFKGGEVSIALQQYHLAISFYEKCFKKYPDYERRPDCLYLQGFIYDNHLEYHAVAKENYERVIKEFPNHPYAKDAEAAIQTLTMSDEELIKMFKEKEKQQQDSLQAAS